MSVPNEFRLKASTTAVFLMEVDGVEIGAYTEVSGLEVKMDPDKIEEGGVNGHVHLVPTRLQWTNIVLKRGITKDDRLFDWFNRTVGEGFAKDGKVARTTAAITLVSRTGERLRAWELIDAMPVRWSGPKFAGDAKEAPSEELEVAHHGFRPKTF